MNCFDRNGAELLSAAIKAYWLERGYDVDVRLVPAPFATQLRSGRYDVRSDMRNGLPKSYAISVNPDFT